MKTNKIQRLSANLKKSFQDPLSKKTWQSGIGLSVFTLFVLSSIIVGGRSVHALNQAVGYYGYYSGTYGYNGSTTSSDQVPSAPSALSSSSVASTTATVSWTAPTTTTNATAIATGGGSISSYKFHYSTSSLSSCSGGTSSTPTSASESLTGLTANTTYYVAVCATDNNVNDSSALTGSFTTTAATGGNSGGGGGGGATGPTYPTGTPSAAAPGTSLPTPTATVTSVKNSAAEFGVTLSTVQVDLVSSFITNGTTAATVKLGSGERLALVRDQLETLGRVDVTALEQLAAGQIPTARNLSKEQAQVGKVLTAFVKLTGHRPNFKIAKENIAWNTMMYRIRFSRDLNKERAGITVFRSIYAGRTPTSPLDWAVV
ncbi:MAG: hypothetical protein Q7S48_03270, partial [bacterium]|nr:hypothetical protein [bacterium]